MKALRYFGERDIRHDSMEDPKLESDRDAIVQMTACSICGSDLHIYHGHGFSEDTGFCVGHEAVGEIVEVGRAVTRVKVGDKITAGQPLAFIHGRRPQDGASLEDEVRALIHVGSKAVEPLPLVLDRVE